MIKKNNLIIDDFYNANFISSLKLNNSKTLSCFLVSKPSKELNKYISTIYCMDIKNKTIKEIKTVKSNNYFWFDDNQVVVDVSENNSKNKISKFLIINVLNLSEKEFFSINRNVVSINKLNDNDYIFTELVDLKKFNTTDCETHEKEIFEKLNNDMDDYAIFDKLPIWSDGIGMLDSKVLKLFLYKKDKNKIIPLSKNDQFLVNYEIFDDKIVFVTSNFNNILSQKNSIYVYESKNDLISCYLRDTQFSINYANFIDENNIITLMSKNDKYGINQNSDFYLINRFELIPRLISNFDYSCSNTSLTDVRFYEDKTFKIINNNLYFIATIKTSVNLYKINIKGEINQITNINGSIDSFELFDDNSILTISLIKNKLQEIYMFKDKNIMKITNFNKNIYDKETSIPKHFVLRKNDVEIDGYIIEPINKIEGKKYPAILEIHGGPKCIYNSIFFFEMQILASSGYYVFYCNPRGSDGKGNEFADIRGKYGTIDYEDIIEFKNKILSKYKECIDHSNVGVIGGSYGGFMVNWIIGHTNEFKTAISLRGISSWLSMYGTSDIGYFFGSDQCDILPNLAFDNDLNIMLENSPISYTSKIKTPTMFMHSMCDYRCFYVESLSMYSILKVKNIDTQLVLFKNESHDLSRSGKPKNRVKRLELIVNWFDKHLKK